MQILTDTGMDTHLSADELTDLKISTIPQLIMFEGRSYRSGVDMTQEELLDLLTKPNCYPTTSLPSVGDFAETYRRMAKVDPDILSIHVSGVLSGTYQAAVAAADMVPEANVTVVDGRSVSLVLGWQVAAAGWALRMGWSKQRIVDLITRIGQRSRVFFTMKELRHLIRGGRVSHLRGMLASALQIKPVLGIDPVNGKLGQLGLARTFKGALDSMLGYVNKTFDGGQRLLVQAGHSCNIEGLAMLRERLNTLVQARNPSHLLPDIRLSAVLMVHAGPTLVGMGAVPMSVFEDLPVFA